MKTSLHLETTDICDAVWDKATGDIKAGYHMSFSEPDFRFTFDDDGHVSGIDVTFEVYKEEEA